MTSQLKEEYQKAMEKERGTVKWFNGSKGYGFITRAEGEDVFVHFSAIEAEGFRTLSEGEQVEFAVERGPKGLQAVRVKRVGLGVGSGTPGFWRE